MTATTHHDLKTLILSFHPVIAVETVEEDRVETLLHSLADELGLEFFDWSVTHGLVRHPSPSAFHKTGEPFGLLQHIKGLTVDGIFHLKDFARYMTEAAVERQFREVAQLFARKLSTIVLTGRQITLPGDVEPYVVHFELAMPTSDELRATIEPTIASLTAARSVEYALDEEGINALLGALSGMTLNQARQAVAYAALVDGRLGSEDVARVLDRKVQVIRDGGLLEYFPVVSNAYQLGGFARLRAWLDRARMGYSDEARALNLQPPRGILLVGVQGCGKSLAAKVIARQWQLPLLKLDAGRLYDRYVGESEKNLRRAINMAESMAPAVLWIDEIEKAIGSGNADADGGVSRRIFGTFLTWLQEKQEAVFVVATANTLADLAPELLRKGRFDEIFFVDLPTTDERHAIFGIHLELRKQDPSRFDVEQLTEATQGFSGAEIEQAIVAALYTALHRGTPLDTDLLTSEISQTVPLATSRHEEIEGLRAHAATRFVPVR